MGWFVTRSGLAILWNYLWERKIQVRAIARKFQSAFKIVICLGNRNQFAKAFGVLGLAVLILCFFCQASAQAARIKWAGQSYSHLSHEENIVDLLRDFCSSQGISVVVSEKVSGTISGRFNNYSPDDFLKHIATAYGLVWYFDGSVLYIYRSDEMQSRMIDMEYVPVSRLRQILHQLDLMDGRFPLKTIEKEGLIYISGPERYVNQVAEAVAMLEGREEKAAQSKMAKEVVRVFPLRYAWAQDQTYTFMSNEVTVPGVATILTNLLSGTQMPALVQGRQNRRLSASLEKLKGQGLAQYGRVQPVDPVNGDGNSPVVEMDRGAQSAPPNAPEGYIQADARLNAVIIRDSENKLPYYEEIISCLDVPSGLVQIRATIIDINTDALRELGVNWRFNADNRVIGGINADSELSIDSDTLALGSGLNLATIVGNANEFLLSRINALEERDKAHILSQPSVLTLNNVEATLEHGQTMHVRVAGNEEVDLYNVSAGILLRVTPHIIEDTCGRKIKLSVNIEDGDFSDTETVDDIPIVENSTINTQAVVSESESLLIGGYYRNSRSRDSSGVPCLASIPGIGFIFRHKKVQHIQTKRLFLITPEILVGKTSSEEFDEDWTDPGMNEKQWTKEMILGRADVKAQWPVTARRLPDRNLSTGLPGSTALKVESPAHRSQAATLMKTTVGRDHPAPLAADPVRTPPGEDR